MHEQKRQRESNWCMDQVFNQNVTLKFWEQLVNRLKRKIMAIIVYDIMNFARSWITSLPNCKFVISLVFSHRKLNLCITIFLLSWLLTQPFSIKLVPDYKKILHRVVLETKLNRNPRNKPSLTKIKSKLNQFLKQK